MVDINFRLVVAPAATAKEINALEQGTWKTVSYTHLTLPTILLV